MSDNPFQSPANVEVGFQYDPLTDIVAKIPRLDFETNVSRRDLLNAITKTQFRPEFRRPEAWKRVVAILLLIGLIMLFLAMAVLPGSPVSAFWIALMLGVTLSIVWYSKNASLRQLITNNLRTLGRTSGFLEQDILYIQSQHRKTFRKLSSLVIASTNEERVVMCFDPMLNRFETLPFAAFADVKSAQLLARDLESARSQATATNKPSKPDAAPMSENFFQPSESAIFFAGPILNRDLAGSHLIRMIRTRIFKSLAFVLLIFVAVPMAIMVAFGLTATTVSLLALAVALFVLIFINLIAQGRRFRSPDQTVLTTRGWIEPIGLTTVSHDAQDASTWSAFKDCCFTENAILINWPDRLHCSIVTKNQLGDPNQWEAACEIVRNHVLPRK